MQELRVVRPQIPSVRGGAPEGYVGGFRRAFRIVFDQFPRTMFDPETTNIFF